MTDDELIVLCEAQIEQAIGEDGGELAEDRAKWLRYYLGNVERYLPHEEGRSGFVSRDVLDTVESVLPSLMRIFMEADNAVYFEPVGPEDEQQARMETELVRQTVFTDNNSFLNIYSFCKDALISGVGTLKTWFEEGEEEREEYEGLTFEQYSQLLADPGWTVVRSQDEQTEDGRYDVVLHIRREPGKVQMDVVPPEELGVSPNCRTPDIKKAPFVCQRRRATKSELVESGYDREVVESLTFSAPVTTSSEEAARYFRSDEDEFREFLNESMGTVWVTECYIRVDTDDDGIAELHKVTLGGDVPGGVLLDREPVDSIPFATASPILVTHKFVGLSLAELVHEIMEIRSTLLRGVLDNMYLANQGRMAVNDLVNLDDALVSRAGGLIRIEGDVPPSQALMPLQNPAVPQQTFGLLEVLDGIIKNRTGVGDEVMGLDMDSLAHINTGVMIQAYDAARMRIELMARVLAEVGLKTAFKDVHELLCKHADRPLQKKLFGQWVPMDPREWKNRTNIRVGVGVGNQSKERDLMALQTVMQTQQMLGGTPVVQPQNMYAVASGIAARLGVDSEAYFTDPRTLPPPPPPPPDPALIKAQADAQRVQIEAQRVGSDQQIKTAQTQGKLREMEMRSDMEVQKAQMSLHKQQVDEQSQMLNAATSAKRQEADALAQMLRQQLDAERFLWQKRTDEVDARLDKYKADLDSVTRLIGDTKNSIIRSLQSELKDMRKYFGQSG